jgi:hypothetical protein
MAVFGFDLEAAGFEKVVVDGHPYWSLKWGDVELAFEPKVFGGWYVALYDLRGPGSPQLISKKKVEVM